MQILRLREKDFIGSVRRSLAFKPLAAGAGNGDRAGGSFGGFVEKIGSSIRKLKIFSNAGAMGVLIYFDQYGGVGGGTKWFPDDTWLPPSGVHVGSVFNGAGDPTTPGWPSSLEGCERLSEDEVERAGDVPLIPSLPISDADGEEILRWIGGVVAFPITFWATFFHEDR
ncbi:putative glutamate carboxypeptidase II [Helianthus annuus]|uniref:Glutamate carboxypeptidase II n=1 Tax=Helianthus annuus TaxID=4232 RepID=A0A251SD40_HELAN|nr:putative glutamate carboxypeptidase II [Helianthus annuus]KAJ0451344.1 putative glutamate carboxypeptidase II [Helianthus annuus]KAJ0455836.1 putative glutamate carboxypeptidase II [Helianthus annuus]KAJ0473218.1 putative glutamate carboxypeptidase II [Helianthus annuus]KAJ0648808.1 putative glutamate carboxypeptidase II [Helianthus annuus]